MNAQEKRQYIEQLFVETCSCVIVNGATVRTFRDKGVKDLYRLLRTEPELLRGAFVADKVAGKGAAALLIAGGIGSLFADVVSHPALELLNSAGIPTEYTLAVPRIANRSGTGICPLEQCCADCTTAAECLPRIEAFMNEMRHKR